MSSSNTQISVQGTGSERGQRFNEVVGRMDQYFDLVNQRFKQQIDRKDKYLVRQDPIDRSDVCRNKE